MTRTYISTTPELIGEKVMLQGWVGSKRDHGKVTFIDLRDKSGIVQCVGFKMMGELTPESVVEIEGLVKARPESMINVDIPTGTIEVEVETYTILNKAEALPIPVEGDGRDISEEQRLRYRYLDLRRARLQKNVRLRSDFTRAISDALYKREFVEIETPMLTKSTKEGARDFIVPSRFQPGKFYALPQSPQQYKQLLMTAGFEKYFQIARCFRDEDLRADRGFELTQVDIEMSFVDQEAVMNTVESVVKEAVTAVGGVLKDNTFPVVTYQEAMDTYGADRFDLRTPEEKEKGVLAFAWVVGWPFFKKVDKDDAAEVRDGKSGWTFTHNPFSTSIPEHKDWHLNHENIDQIMTAQYDLVCNGYEVGGGSVRAHTPEMLTATFKIMGYTDEQIQEGVGHMLEAFKVGTPPHGGLALGLDRMIMVLSGETSMKESVAFPMTASGRTAIMDAPSSVSTEQLHEVSLAVSGQKEVYQTIIDMLIHDAVDFENYSHVPVYTSEEAAKVRGEEINMGAKALVLQADKEFILYTLPGDQRADLAAVQAFLGVKKLAMASKESIKAKTGLEIGSIPPFGSAMGLKTYVHRDLTTLEKIAFNPGRHDKSIVMRAEDFVRLEKPIIVK